jgi:hypothetical protein
MPMSLSPFVYVTTTWANRPTASAVAVGTVFAASDIGPAGTLFRSDGTAWRPLNGRALLYQRAGSIASPISTLSGVTSGTFTLPAAMTIPAGLIPTHGTLLIRARVQRTGANATASFNVRLGTAGTTSDSILTAPPMAATTLLICPVDTMAFFGTGTTSCVSNSSLPWNGANNTTANYADKSANINTASAMQVTLDISAANASDSFALHAYSLELQA